MTIICQYRQGLHLPCQSRDQCSPWSQFVTSDPCLLSSWLTSPLPWFIIGVRWNTGRDCWYFSSCVLAAYLILIPATFSSNAQDAVFWYSWQDHGLTTRDEFCIIQGNHKCFWYLEQLWNFLEEFSEDRQYYCRTWRELLTGRSEFNPCHLFSGVSLYFILLSSGIWLVCHLLSDIRQSIDCFGLKVLHKFVTRLSCVSFIIAVQWYSGSVLDECTQVKFRDVRFFIPWRDDFFLTTTIWSLGFRWQSSLWSWASQDEEHYMYFVFDSVPIQSKCLAQVRSTKDLPLPQSLTLHLLVSAFEFQ